MQHINLIHTLTANILSSRHKKILFLAFLFAVVYWRKKPYYISGYSRRFGSNTVPKTCLDVTEFESCKYGKATNKSNVLAMVPLQIYKLSNRLHQTCGCCLVVVVALSCQMFICMCTNILSNSTLEQKIYLLAPVSANLPRANKWVLVLCKLPQTDNNKCPFSTGYSTHLSTK